MTISNAPSKFIESITEPARHFALLYAHTPDARAKANLDDYVGRIEPAVEAIGGDRATIILNAFRGAVMGRKREIEGNRPSSGSLH